MAAIDPSDFRESQHKHWDSAAVGWMAWSEFNDRADRQVSERLVELAGVRRGSRVLDVAAGYGEPALTAARKAGPQGSVVATDISAEMLAFARERAAAAGLDNVEFVESTRPASTFRRRASTPRSPVGESFRARRGGSGRAHPGIPEAGRPDGDRLVGRGRPGPVLLHPDEDDDGAAQRFPAPARNARPPLRPTPDAIGGLLEGGGFSQVAVEQDEVTFEFGSPQEFTAYVRAISAPIRAMIEQHAGEAQEEAWDAITQAAAGSAAARDP